MAFLQGWVGISTPTGSLSVLLVGWECGARALAVGCGSGSQWRAAEEHHMCGVLPATSGAPDSQH